MEDSKILDKIDKNTNIIFYDKNVYKCYTKLKEDHICVYFKEPTPIKGRLIEIINTIGRNDKNPLNPMTIPELTDLIINDPEYDRLIIIFNNFERLTKRTVQVYQQLYTSPNIQFICSFSEQFKKEIYPFYKQFELVNNEEYEKNSTSNEINVTYVFYIIITLYCLLFYLKFASSALQNVYVLIGAIWFVLIIFRTLFYMGGRP